jgi:hypothetical protein
MDQYDGVSIEIGEGLATFTTMDLADLGQTIDQEHAVWTTRSNRMVFSWMDVNWLHGWRTLPSGVDRVISRDEILRTGRWLNPKVWSREIMEKLRATPHSEPLTDTCATWTSDFLSREGKDREVIGDRL